MVSTFFSQVLNACVQQKQWEGAFWVLQQLKQRWIQPSSTTYGLVMEVQTVQLISLGAFFIDPSRGT